MSYDLVLLESKDFNLSVSQRYLCFEQCHVTFLKESVFIIDRCSIQGQLGETMK